MLLKNFSFCPGATKGIVSRVTSQFWNEREVTSSINIYQTRKKPGAALQTASWFIHSLSEWPFPPTALRRRHAQTVRDSTSIYKIDHVIGIKNFLNPKGHQNRITGSKVTAILLKGWILPIGGAVIRE